MSPSPPSEPRETPDQEANRKSGLAYAAGFTLFASVAGFTLIGWLVDKWFQTTPWFLVLGIVLGSACGLYQFVRISSKTL
ncbi:MAG TPA: AtpZ/AtpI family protein [Pyrinomonadaceae bacterium]|jgi:ATP synthase protein I